VRPNNVQFGVPKTVALHVHHVNPNLVTSVLVMMSQLLTPRHWPKPMVTHVPIWALLNNVQYGALKTVVLHVHHVNHNQAMNVLVMMSQQSTPRKPQFGFVTQSATLAHT
jgi:hypothetical protein